MNASKGMGAGRWRRAGYVAWFALASALLAGAGPAGAQGDTTYTGLRAAVNGMSRELIKDGQLAGKQVAAGVHDFYQQDRGSKRILPLSTTLRDMFRSELRRLEPGVKVVKFAEKKDEVLTLQGAWKVTPGKAADEGKKTIILEVMLLTKDLKQEWSVSGIVGGIEAKELTPTLVTWGQHVVKVLERNAKNSEPRVVHMREFEVNGVEESGSFKKYLTQHWLLPALAESRQFTFSRGEGERTNGALDVDVDVRVGTEWLQIVLNVFDERGKQFTSAQLEKVSRELVEEVFEVEPDRRHLAIESGIIGMSRESLPELQRESDCEHNRGLVNARHDFERPFAEPPKVIAALSAIAARSKNEITLMVEVGKIDSDGFHYHLKTWCDTLVSWAQMSWIAHGFR